MIDKVDRKILGALQRESRRPIAEVAEKVGLSLSACARRIGILEDRGAIDGYTARLNAEALGFKMIFYVEVSLDSQADAALAKFEKAAVQRPEVLECHLTSGAADYLIKVAARDTEDYERTYRRAIASLPHVSRIQSALVMKTVKEWRGYPTE